MVIVPFYLSHFKNRKEPYMIKRILLSLLVVMPLLAKHNPQDDDLMAKLNKLEQIKKEIDKKEKYIDKLISESSIIFNYMGDDQAQKELILSEGSKLERHIVHALQTNTNIEQALKEPLCPAITDHRNELDRMQNIIVRVCMEYFLLKGFYQLYSDIASQIVKIQLEIIK